MDFFIYKVLIVTSIEHRDDGNGRPLTIGYSHCCWLQNHLWYIVASLSLLLNICCYRCSCYCLCWWRGTSNKLRIKVSTNKSHLRFKSNLQPDKWTRLRKTARNDNSTGSRVVLFVIWYLHWLSQKWETKKKP